MLLTAEGVLKSSRDSVLTVEQTSSFKRNSTEKKKDKPKQKAFKKKTADKRKCFHCNNDGHWKRNYFAYLASLKNKKDSMPFEYI